MNEVANRMNGITNQMNENEKESNQKPLTPL
jgi:hypothetical protein